MIKPALYIMERGQNQACRVRHEWPGGNDIGW